MGGRGKADRQAPRFAHREDEGVVVGSQQSDEKEEGVKNAPCACPGSYSPLFPPMDHAYAGVRCFSPPPPQRT